MKTTRMIRSDSAPYHRRAGGDEGFEERAPGHARDRQHAPPCDHHARVHRRLPHTDEPARTDRLGLRHRRSFSLRLLYCYFIRGLLLSTSDGEDE